MTELEATLKHEAAHGIGLILCAKARAVKIIVKASYAEAIPAWDGEPTDEQILMGLIAGRAFSEGLDTSLDEAQIAGYDDEVVERIAAFVLPIVRDRLEFVDDAMIAAMLEAIGSEGAILLTPEALH